MAQTSLGWILILGVIFVGEGDLLASLFVAIIVIAFGIYPPKD